MVIIKSFVSALSLYSKIPMPNLTYDEGDDKYSLCFFPVVGVIILLVVSLVMRLLPIIGINDIATRIIICIIPIIVTGGIHIDGFMDVMDAMHSYGDKNKRLEILADPHIGAFCVIKLVELCGIWVASFMAIKESFILLAAIGFIVSRALSGMALLCFKPARDTGMLIFTKSHADTAICRIVLVIWIVMAMAGAYIIYGIKGISPFAISVLTFCYYRYKSSKDFGGITGDTEGCFLVMNETAFVLTALIMGLI